MIYWQLIHWAGHFIGSGQSETLDGVADQVRAAVASLPLRPIADTDPLTPEYRLRIERSDK